MKLQKETQGLLYATLLIPVMGAILYRFAKTEGPLAPFIAFGMFLGAFGSWVMIKGVKGGWITLAFLAPASQASALGLFGGLVIFVGGLFGVAFVVAKVWSKMIDVKQIEEKRNEQREKVGDDVPLARVSVSPSSSYAEPHGQLAATPSPWTFTPMPGLSLSVPAGGSVQWSSNLVDWSEPPDTLTGDVGFWRVIR